MLGPDDPAPRPRRRERRRAGAAAAAAASSRFGREPLEERGGELFTGVVLPAERALLAGRELRSGRGLRGGRECGVRDGVASRGCAGTSRYGESLDCRDKIRNQVVVE